MAKKTMKKAARWVISILFLMVFSWVLVTFAKQELTIRSQEKQKNNLIIQKQKLEEEALLLKRLQESADTPEYIKRAARKKLGWVTQGEIIIPDATAKP